MNSLRKPRYKVKETFTKCISKVRDQNLKDRLSSCTKSIVLAQRKYNLLMKKGNIHSVLKSDNVDGIVTQNEMVVVYDSRMVKYNSPGRVIYDDLMSMPQYGVCPYCSERIVSTLDHYLSKTEYPIFSVTPINLVASCMECNKSKHVYSPTKLNDCLLHPYYDDVEKFPWLVAKVHHSNPIVITYEVMRSGILDAVLADRIEKQFKICKLNLLYSSKAQSELCNIAHTLIGISRKGGEEALRLHLKECYLSRREYRINSWQTALYLALLEDEWFIGEGVARL